MDTFLFTVKDSVMLRAFMMCLVCVVGMTAYAEYQRNDIEYDGDEVPQMLESQQRALEMQGYSPLQIAVIEGNIKKVSALLDTGVDVQAVNEFGETALHLVERCEDDRVETKIALMKLLISHGAIVDSPDIEGMTPIFSTGVELIGVLLEAGADGNWKSDNGISPIQWFAYSNESRGIELLLAHGADVNYNGSNDRKSALHIAANWGHLESAKILIKHGAKINAKDLYGKTPLQLAILEGGEKMRKLLIENGAEPPHGKAQGTASRYGGQ
jgi:ankyrin repeat protein